MTIPSIVARSISKTYRRGRQLITALQNVAFEVSQGELVLLIGPSGRARRRFSILSLRSTGLIAGKSSSTGWMSPVCHVLRQQDTATSVWE
jgi:ABC-type ATPase involved in cell division